MGRVEKYISSTAKRGRCPERLYSNLGGRRGRSASALPKILYRILIVSLVGADAPNPLRPLQGHLPRFAVEEFLIGQLTCS